MLLVERPDAMLDHTVQVACLGVTESDWRVLGQQAMQALAIHEAVSAFERVGDARMLHAAQHLAQQCNEGLPRPLAQATALAILVSITQLVFTPGWHGE